MLDIQEIQNDIYSDQGIYYEPDEQNVMAGTLLVWGPIGTHYEDMPMCYYITFPQTYPFDPPHAGFMTSDGVTRFHPNMYREGKVCLSILGTWEGPKWTGTLRLSSVGLTLQSLMDNNPIAHEPGYANRKESSITDYNDFIGSKCIHYLTNLIVNYLTKKILPNYLRPFESVFLERLPNIIKRLESRLETIIKNGEKTWNSLPYNLCGSSNYASCLQALQTNRSKIDELTNSTCE